MMNNKNRCIKISFLGETKRIKMVNSYDSLVQQTKEKFPGPMDKLWPIKFYYLDDEQELISITSQSDFLEAVDIMQDVSALKLIVADSAQDARQWLEQQIGDNVSMASSMKLGSNPLNRGTTLKLDGLQDFLQQPPVVEQRCMTERVQNTEKDNFMVNMKNMFQDAISQVKGLVQTQQPVPEPVIMPISEPELPSMSEKISQPISESPTNIIQINTKVKEEVVEKKEEVAPAKEVQGLNKEIVEEVQAQIKKLMNAGLKDEVEKLKPKKALVVHKDHICDGCNMEPIVGIRYQCTMRPDYDLCEKCEAKPEQRAYTFLKIRKTSQAPHSVTCKYPEEGGMKFPDMHIDQVINVDEMAQKFQNFCGMFMNGGQQQQQPANNDLKQPTEIPTDLKQPEPEIPKVEKPTDFKSAEKLADYEIEDLPIRDDLSELEPKGTVTNLEIGDKVIIGEPVLSDDLKIETPKVEIEKPLSPEEIYSLEASAENAAMQKALMQLHELGFAQFARNKELLTKFNYNIETVASVLIEDMELYD